MTTLTLYNTKTRQKGVFEPLDPGNVRVYLCGPTVYDLAHIGNARNTVLFDILVRLLRRRYPRVTYVRNITDVEDKINARAAARGESIAAVTAETAAAYHADMAALGNLPPDLEPRVTQHLPEIVMIIERLVAGGFAYAAEGHVLFSVGADPGYGKFSGRAPEELLAGARVEIAPYKKSPGDFVLWKPSTPDLPGWDSPWGRGRPGWHIECSAMSWKLLGEDFDIHGGGDDLIFPHHENEIAQSCCAFPGSGFARVWVHNRMLLVNGEKMSKSLGNFVTIQDALANVPGEVLRLFLLSAHYRSTLDYTVPALQEARQTVDRFYRALSLAPEVQPREPEHVLAALLEDLNTPLAISAMHVLATNALRGDADAAAQLRGAGEVLGLLSQAPADWFRGDIDQAAIDELVSQRLAARQRRDYVESDRLRRLIAAQGILIEDGPGGTYSLRKA